MLRTSEPTEDSRDREEGFGSLQGHDADVLKLKLRETLKGIGKIQFLGLCTSSLTVGLGLSPLPEPVRHTPLVLLLLMLLLRRWQQQPSWPLPLLRLFLVLQH